MGSRGLSNRASEGTMGELHNDWAARGEGASRSSEFSGLRSSGAWGSGSFRPSGGGSRGFGGRR